MSIPDKDKTKILSKNLFPVVGIGASAGGLDAFKKFIKAIPENSGMAYILVQHLDPSHDSILPELLQKVTNIPVEVITDNVHVLANNIYIIPSNKLLTATDGILQLSARPPKNSKHMPIDLFFTSLSEVHQSHAIGVVLSGTAQDGTLGLQAIKEHGGLTFAQTPLSAAYDSMPQSAINAGVVDFILAPEAMPEHLLELQNQGQIKMSKTPAPKDDSKEEEYTNIISLLRVRKQVDFRGYKLPTIHRRISRRMKLTHQKNVTLYHKYLRDNPEEQDQLFQDLLIPVTGFFRDPEIFEFISKSVLPVLFKHQRSEDILRVWVAGCSTGEEAYSILMCLHEFLGDKTATTTIQVFATDISEVAITKARSGSYSKNEIGGLSASRLQQFFTRVDDKFRLNKNIRDACVFAKHNYLKDPPFAQMDLVSCRNSLIYMEPRLQKKALTTFHYALKNKGFLILGKSETTGQAVDLFNTLDKSNKIFTAKAVKGNFRHGIAGSPNDQAKQNNNTLSKNESLIEEFEKKANQLLLSKFAPAGVIVNDEWDIVQFRGATGKWLEASEGKPDLNVLRMVREGLAFELRNALHKVKKNQQVFIKENIQMSGTGQHELVTIEILPLQHTSEKHYLILFREISEIPASSAGKSKKRQSKKSPEQLEIESLRKELLQSREDMRHITEDQEASNEELQSANEELLSGSEELQSLNEELQTSKEEIQTTNEELVVVNQELYDRNEQLNLSRKYAESIVTTIREPLLILDEKLQVKSANKSFYKKFNTNEEAAKGKSLFELENKQWDIPGLREMLEKVIPGKTPVEDMEVVISFPRLGARIMLLNAAKILRDNNEESSILLAMEDITESKREEMEMKMFAQNLEKQVHERTILLNEANVGLQLSNKNLEQFAYIASHDLQEPLRKILTFSSMLDTKYKSHLPEPGQDLLGKITTSSERMSTLIKEVLNYSMILHGDSVYEKVDLNAIAEKVIADFDLLISEKNATVTCAQLPVIEAMPFQMNQLFNNLIGNALKFSKAGIPPVIKITCKKLTATELQKHPHLHQKFSFYSIKVQDNGIGFDQQFAEKIFLIFNRLHGQGKFTGTGIGLALCKTIVVNHQGEIGAVSTKDDGALFEIILPVKQLKTAKYSVERLGKVAV